MAHVYNGIESAKEIKNEIVGKASAALVSTITGELN